MFSLILFYSVFRFVLTLTYRAGGHRAAYILSCSRSRNNQIELRKREIQKYKNRETEY